MLLQSELLRLLVQQTGAHSTLRVDAPLRRVSTGMLARSSALTAAGLAS